MSSLLKKKSAGNLNDYIPEYINVQLEEFNNASKIDGLNHKLDEFYINLQGQITKYNQINNQISEYMMEQINEIKENCQPSGIGQSFSDDINIIQESIKILNSKITENIYHYPEELQNLKKSIDDLYNKIESTAISSEQMKYEFNELKEIYNQPSPINSNKELLELKEQLAIINENQATEITNKIDELKQIYAEPSSNKIEQSITNQIQEMKNSISVIQDKVEKVFNNYEVSQKSSNENYINLLGAKLEEVAQSVNQKIDEKLILELDKNKSEYPENLHEFKKSMDDLYNKLDSTGGISLEQMKHEFDQLKELYIQPASINSNAELIELKEQISTIYELMHEDQTTEIISKIDELKQIYNELFKNNIKQIIENQMQEIKSNILTMQNKMENNSYRHETLQRLSKESYTNLLETKLEETTQLIDKKIDEKLMLELIKIEKNTSQYPESLQEFKKSITDLYSKIESTGISSEQIKHEFDQLKELYVQPSSQLVDEKITEKLLLEPKKDNKKGNPTLEDITQMKERIENLYKKVSEQPMDLCINLDVQELNKQISIMYKNITNENNDKS